MVRVELTERDAEKQLSTKGFHLNIPFPNRLQSNIYAVDEIDLS